MLPLDAHRQFCRLVAGFTRGKFLLLSKSEGGLAEGLFNLTLPIAFMTPGEMLDYVTSHTRGRRGYLGPWHCKPTYETCRPSNRSGYFAL